MINIKILYTWTDYSYSFVHPIQLGMSLDSDMIGQTINLNWPFKVGDEMPETWTVWFEFDQETFNCLRGSTHSKDLAEVLKARGLTVQAFYKKLLTDVYKARLGADKKEEYHMERDYDELKGLLGNAEADGGEQQKTEEEEKRAVEHGEADQTAVEQRREEERAVEQRREEKRAVEQRREEEGALEQRQEVQIQRDQKEKEKLEQSLKKKMSIHDLQSIHKEAKTYSAKTSLQVLEKHFDPESGRLSSLTLSDGAYVSSNVIPRNDKAAEYLNQINKFDLIEIENATMKEDKLVLDEFEHLEITHKNGKPIKLSGPILGEGIVKLKKLGAQSMKLWGVKFPFGQQIDFHCKRQAPALDATILASDPIIAEVGASSRAPEPQPSDPLPQPQPLQRPKRKLLQCPLCVRSFLELQSMLEHCNNDHE